MQTRLVVIGLGYVGLPLAVALAKRFETVGLDIDHSRISELRAGVDRTGEIGEAALRTSTLTFCDKAADCPPADVYIVTVPTPVDENDKPDLRLLIKASETVGRMLHGKRKPIVVFESTVYPGVTEEICGAALEKASGLRRGEDFFLGYSPERINPGDREHTVDRITKVVAGENPEVTERLAGIYGAITTGGIFVAASIRAAEAAKVIENAQRDINIAFMNEVARVLARLDVSVWDVLAAANTKWNFLSFQPGLVGGHCIGVDPYYLSHCATELGYDPKVILSGRSINDDMGRWVAEEIHRREGGTGGRSVLMMGVTFKEDVRDLRNSKVVDVIRRLEQLGHQVTVHDPLADPAEAKREHGIDLDQDALGKRYEVVVLAVPHRSYRAMGGNRLRALLSDGGLLADLKNVHRDKHLGDARRWTL